MEDVKLRLDGKGNGTFYIMDEKEQLGELVIGISGNELIAYHTEVSPKAEGKGLAKKLLSALVDYARKNDLKVVAPCAFVAAQFTRHPEQYADIRKETERTEG